ncbi:MAG: MFS transporter [Chloroflexota bacterium]|nr:MFS transporter [Chloroflexota bacterium]
MPKSPPIAHTPPVPEGFGPKPLIGSPHIDSLLRPLVRVRDRVAPALAYKQYSRLWQANAGSQVAFWMQQVAQGWLVLDLTGSEFTLGLLAFFRSIPMLLLSPLGGVLADRLDRRRMVLVAQLILAGLMLTIAILVVTNQVHVVHLAVSSLVVGTMFAVNVPARTALVAGLVPRQHLANAIGLHSATLNSARIIGPSLAGQVIATVGIAGSYFVQVGGYVWSSVNMLRVVPPPRSPRPRSSTWADMRGGFAYVARTRIMLALMLLALGPSLFGMPLMTLLPAFVRKDLGGGPEAFGFLLGVLGVGALVGSALVVTFSRFREKGRALVAAILVYAALLVLLAFTRSFAAAAVVVAFMGFSQSVYMSVNQMALQLLVPDALRGRVMALRMMTFGLSPLGLLPLSVIAEVQGTPTAILLGGLATAVVGIGVPLWVRDIWRLRPDDADPDGLAAPRTTG